MTIHKQFPDAKADVPANRLLTRKEVSAVYGVPIGYLEKNATNGNGPRIVRIGRAVRYRRQDVEAWIDSCAAHAPPVHGSFPLKPYAGQRSPTHQALQKKSKG